MQRKTDQAPNAHGNDAASTVTTTKLAEKRSKQFLYEVLYPRGIKVISDSLRRSTLKSLQEYLGSNHPASKEVLGNAFVELDGSKVTKGFKGMKMDSENEATFEAEYRDTFLKSGCSGELDAVCRFVQPNMIVEGLTQNTWIPLPVVTDRRESGIALSTTVWDLVSNIYPDKAGEDRGKYFIPDHIYAFNAKDEEEEAKINHYHREGLPGFLLLKGRNGIKPPYLVEESKDHSDKECEARQYLSLLAASALHDRMLLRSLTDEAQANKMVALDLELCIYGMTCCAQLVTIYKMSIRDIWSNPDLSKKIEKPVRYDFLRVDCLDLTIPSDCKRLSDWMNTLHLYGRTFQSESVMRDGEKAYFSKKFEAGDWKKELSKVAFLYGRQPNTAIFSTKHTSIGNEGNEGNKDDGDDGDDKEDEEDEEEAATLSPIPPSSNSTYIDGKNQVVSVDGSLSLSSNIGKISKSTTRSSQIPLPWPTKSLLVQSTDTNRRREWQQLASVNTTCASTTITP